MKKYEYMQLENQEPKGVLIIHPTGEYEQVKQSGVFSKSTGFFTQTINKYTSNGWRVIASSPASTKGNLTQKGTTLLTVFLEREIE